MSSPSYEVHVLHEGYAYSTATADAAHVPTSPVLRANGTCTLIKYIGSTQSDVSHRRHVLVDTLSPWDSQVIVSGLAVHGLTCDDIGHVVCTHGHVDHVGNLNLFAGDSTQIIVGHSILSRGDHYYEHPFDEGVPYRLGDNDDLEVIATPGHTTTDVSVIVRSVNNYGTVAIVGDLFEREEDIEDEALWRDEAGSENPTAQRLSRSRVLHMADYVVPGHGKMFKVTDAMKALLDSQV